METEWKPTQEQIIEANLGKETLSRAGQSADEIFAAMKIALLHINSEEGPSDQKREKAEQYLEMWNNFANMLYAKTTGVETVSMPASEKIEIALKGATSLLTPEAGDQDKESAHMLMTELNKRFHFPEFNS